MLRPEQLGAPIIPPVTSDTVRPVWSVMIPVYNRTTWLEQALQSVIQQSPPGESVQIEVVDDQSDASHGVEALVHGAGQGRIGYHRNAHRLGMVGNWNFCIERARGELVHLLHDDDFVLPGFYDALGAAMRARPEVGLAFCSVVVVDQAGKQIENPDPQSQSATLMPEWTEWIGVTNAIRLPGVVMRRNALEAVGGFHPALSHAVDWEMWMRLASQFPVWHEPRALGVYRKHEKSETSRQMQQAENVADIARVLEISRTYMPADRADEIVSRSKHYWAVGMVNAARELMSRGELVAGIQSMRETLKLSISPMVTRSIEMGVMRGFDKYMESVAALLHKHRVLPADAAAAAEVRRIRRQLVRQWLAVPPRELRIWVETDLGQWQERMLKSTIVAQPPDELDLAILKLAADSRVASLAWALFPRESRPQPAGPMPHWLAHLSAK